MADSAEPLERPHGVSDVPSEHAGKPDHPAGTSKHSVLSSAESVRRQVVKAISETDRTIERLNT